MRIITSLLSFVFLVVVQTSSAEDQPPLIWAVPGGGERAVSSCMGFASLFVRAGLISSESSKFHSIAANSGGALFMIQYFYSEVFFERLLINDPSQVRDFASEWMSAQNEALLQPGFSPRCAFLLPLGYVVPFFRFMYDRCGVLLPFNFDWAMYMRQVLSSASVAYGDPTLPDRPMTPENRVSAMQDTDFLIQTGLAPGSRVGDKYVTLGPQSNPDASFSYFLAAQYVVENDRSHFRYAEENETMPFVTKTYIAPDTFASADWDVAYPPLSTDLFRAATRLEGPSTNETFAFREPFSGITPTVAQIIAATTSWVAFLSSHSGGFPNVMAIIDYYTKSMDTGVVGKSVTRFTLVNVFKYIYRNNLFADFSICSQWPNDCGLEDSRFVDGGFTDGHSLAQTVSSYQTSPGANLSKTLKIILTEPTLDVPKQFDPFLAHFASPFTEGIAPGDYFWPPAPFEDAPANAFPIRSFQTFVEYYDENRLMAAFEPVPNSSFVTAVLQLTTVDNPSYGIVGGQEVEMLYIALNSHLDPYVISNEEQADLAYSVAASEILLDRIRDFAG